MATHQFPDVVAIVKSVFTDWTAKLGRPMGESGGAALTVQGASTLVRAPEILTHDDDRRRQSETAELLRMAQYTEALLSEEPQSSGQYGQEVR